MSGIGRGLLMRASLRVSLLRKTNPIGAIQSQVMQP